MSDNYIYQKFLTLTDTSGVSLEDYKISRKEIYFLPDYTVSKELFDESDLLQRTVRISELDEIIDTESDFLLLCSKMENIKNLILLDDRPKNQNKIYNAYAEEILKAYIMQFEGHGIECKIVKG